MPYVVTQPDSVRGIYDSWAACKAAVSGVPGARYQKVTDRQEAQAILSGAGVVLGPGLYAFTDGNGQGGVGVVLVRMAADKGSQPQVIQEIATTVGEVFHDGSIPGLDSDQAVGAELGRLANILAELAGLYRAPANCPRGRWRPSFMTTRASAPGWRGAGA